MSGPASRFASSCSPTTTREYVDGKPRGDGVRSFLKSRGIELPLGSADDSPDADTIYGLGLRKNDLVLRLIRDEGVEPYDGSVRFVEAVRDKGLRRAVVSSSENCKDVLAGGRHRGPVRGANRRRSSPRAITSPASRRRTRSWRRPGSSAPSRRRRRCSRTRRPASQAGRAGHFGWVVGVDRTGHARALHAHGADVVVEDLAELLERP